MVNEKKPGEGSEYALDKCNLAITILVIIIIAVAVWGIYSYVSAPEPEQEIDEALQFKSPLCLAIMNNDTSLCDIYREIGPSIDVEEEEIEEYIEGCIRDTIAFNLREYNCESISDETLKGFCVALRENSCESVDDEIKIICEAVINDDINICQTSVSREEITECESFYYNLNIEGINGCISLKTSTTLNKTPINWQKICEAKFSKDESLCAVTEILGANE